MLNEEQSGSMNVPTRLTEGEYKFLTKQNFSWRNAQCEVLARSRHCSKISN